MFDRFLQESVRECAEAYASESPSDQESIGNVE